MAAEGLSRLVQWQPLLPVFGQAEGGIDRRIHRGVDNGKVPPDDFHFVDGTLQAGFHRAAVGIAVEIVLQDGEFGGNHQRGVARFCDSPDVMQQFFSGFLKGASRRRLAHTFDEYFFFKEYLYRG